MPRFYRHEKRPSWGLGRFVKEQEGRLFILFSDGVERKLIASAPGLVEATEDEVPPDSELRKESEHERRSRTASAAGRLRQSTLIKCVRLAFRDGITAAQNDAAYPDDVVIEMQKGLSRITADYARFLGTKAMTVRKVKAETARKSLGKLGIEVLVDELHRRLTAVDQEDWQWTRAYESPSDAADELRLILPLVMKASFLTDEEVETLESLLRPVDLKE